jgi:AbrB family looped-hinge helix DNA binding protein
MAQLQMSYFLYDLYNTLQERYDMTVLTISDKGWVVIPSTLRNKYNLNPGMQVHVVDYGGILSLLPVLGRPIEHSAGILKGKKSLTRALLSEHTQERTRDKKR